MMSRDVAAQLSPAVRDFFAYLFARDRSAPPEAVLLWAALALLPVMLALILAIGAGAYMLTRRAASNTAAAADAFEAEGDAAGRAMRAAARARKAE